MLDNRIDWEFMALMAFFALVFLGIVSFGVLGSHQDTQLKLAEIAASENKVVNETRFVSVTVEPRWFTSEHELLLDAIAEVESGNDSTAIGDGGDSIGAYQIQRAYWQDAFEQSDYLQSLDELGYEDVTQNWYARKVIIAYWDRYGHRVDYRPEGLARQHNGGPNGHSKSVTDNYWEKVQFVLNGR